MVFDIENDLFENIFAYLAKKLSLMLGFMELILYF